MDELDRATFLRLLRKARDRFEAEVPNGREKSIIVRSFDDIELWSLKVPNFTK